MPKNKREKKEKKEPNIVLFLVEGDSDKIALETPLSELLFNINTDYEVRFLQQERPVNAAKDEVDDPDDDDFETEIDYQYGGDITTSSFVTPDNIENKIYRRFILPAVKRDGIYPKKIARIIQIVDLDGAYIPDENVIIGDERVEKTFYDDATGQIHCSNTEAIIDRNLRKRNNLEHLLNLPDGRIRIASKRIPYEIYFFSSNLEHFLQNNANVEAGKRKLANEFLRTYGLDTKKFIDFFLNDQDSLGALGYYESWAEIQKGTKSVSRCTNLDYLISSLIS